MEYIALEIFDKTGTGSKFAVLSPDTSIHVRRTSQIFGSGNVWTYEFQFNVAVNAHIFGTTGDLHGALLHEQINKRRARLWAGGLPLYYGNLRLGEKVDVDADGNVDISFESGQKTFEELIDGISAREVSVGDAVIGVALNRKRVAKQNIGMCFFTMDGLKAYAVKDSRLADTYNGVCLWPSLNGKTPYVQRWPKLVMSYGEVFDSSWNSEVVDYTNIQTPYDSSHPFCNVNICYPFKVNDNGEEREGRGYTMRLARGNHTSDGGDNQTRFNNAPCFYLLHFIDRLFKDLGIIIDENQALNVEDLRRVFMLNFGCHYEEIENYEMDSPTHLTPSALLDRYGQYYLPVINGTTTVDALTGFHGTGLLRNWDTAGQFLPPSKGLDAAGKVLARNVEIQKDGETILSIGSLEGIVNKVMGNANFDGARSLTLDRTPQESSNNSYSAYLAYATGDNYPDVDIKEIISAMESMFGVRLLFSDDFKHVRIVLLRNIFRSSEVQKLRCDILEPVTKSENSIRGFRMTYGKGKEDTHYYYKGFNDLFPRASTTWKDTTDRHDYSQWKTDADYSEIKQSVSAMNKVCYITPINGNAHGVKIDEEEDVLFPSLFEYAGFMDAEDGDCSGESETIDEVQINATPVIMNEIQDAYAVLFTGGLNAPAPEQWDYVTSIATYGRMTLASEHKTYPIGEGLTLSGDFDVYVCEGFKIRLLDNYSVSNGGTPFDEASTGLCLGIMRGSGDDAYVHYWRDAIEDEDNDTWEVEPGSGAIDHPDTCDNYGHEWNYSGTSTIRITTENAESELAELFGGGNAAFHTSAQGYANGAGIFYVFDEKGQRHSALLVTSYSTAGRQMYPADYATYPAYLSGGTVADILSRDRASSSLVVEIDSSQERCDTFLRLCKIAYSGEGGSMTLDNGIGSRYGRFSLKLRAEKLNPNFDASQEESATNQRYLEITDPNLRGRGLADQFYKEYSKFIREAREASIPMNIGIAELINFDDTIRVEVGDLTGFMSEMEFDLSMQDGLGPVTMKLLYI